MNTSQSSLPKHALADLVTIQIGKTPARNVREYFGEGHTWLSIADMNGSDTVSKSKEELTDRAIAESGIKVVPKGSLLFSFKLSIGKVAFAGKDMYTNEAIAAFQIKDKRRVDPRYLYYALRELDFTEGSDKAVKGITLNKRKLEQLQIPLPDDLPTQRRIAAVLDKAQALVANDKRTLALYDQLVGSMYHHRFGNAVAGPTVRLFNNKSELPNGWRWVLLTDVTQLGTGHTPSRRHPEYWDGDIPWLTTGDIRERDGKLTYDTPEKVTEAGIANSSAVLLPTGTVCFCRTASVGFITTMGRPMATSQDFVNWTCGEELDPMYLMHSLMWSREHLRAMASGSTHKTIYFPTVERFAIALPPIKTQRSFSAQLPRISEMKSSAEQSLRQSEALFGSLLQGAFNGEMSE